MNANMLLVLAAAAVALQVVDAAKLPKHWKTCKRNDPNLNKCLEVAINDAVADIMKGVPSLGVLPLEPLHMIRLELDSGANSKAPVSINLTFTDVDFHGFSKNEIKNMEVDWNAGRLKATTYLKAPVQVLGGYSINGKVLLLPIVGKGQCNFTLTDIVMGVDVHGSFVQRDGKKYFHSDKMDIHLDQSRLYMKMDNLFNGDKALGDNMNKFLNENWKEVFEAFRETLQKGLGQAFNEIANRVFDKVPFDNIAPPN